MSSSLDLSSLGPLLKPLHQSQQAFNAAFPGDGSDRQPVHTVYGGAHLFKADTAPRMGQTASRHFEEYFPDPLTLVEAFEIVRPDLLPEGPEAKQAALIRMSQSTIDPAERGLYLAQTLYRRVRDKLLREPVEDFRIDFEDGYGNRSDAEEDAEAERTAKEVALGIEHKTLPPFVGIRIKPLTAELEERAIRTLDIFVTTLAKTAGFLPGGFVVTLPKVVATEQVTTIVRIFELLEEKLKLRPFSLLLELMVETPQSLYDGAGRLALPKLVAAGEGRCVGAHFGVYDYTATCAISAGDQGMRHPACDFARQVMKVALAGTGVRLSDGATNVMPIGLHRGASLNKRQRALNKRAVHRLSRLNYDDVRHSLRQGFYQGWDLHPAQLPVRYLAVYAFFVEQLEPMTARLSSFIDRAAQATLVGEVFDDAATGQALLNFFLRGLACGALSEAEVLATGLTLEELRSRSFKAIMSGRRQRFSGV